MLARPLQRHAIGQHRLGQGADPVLHAAVQTLALDDHAVRDQRVGRVFERGLPDPGGAGVPLDRDLRALKPSGETGGCGESQRCHDLVGELEAWLDAVGVTPPPELAGVVKQPALRVLELGPERVVRQGPPPCSTPRR